MESGQLQSNKFSQFRSLFGDGAVLKLQTVDGTNYQFGMQINPECTQQKVIRLSYEQTKIKHLPFSIAVRVLAIGYLVYWAFERFIANRILKNALQQLRIRVVGKTQPTRFDLRGSTYAARPGSQTFVESPCVFLLTNCG